MVPARLDSPGVILCQPKGYIAAQGLGLTMDYFKPAPWLLMGVRYPMGLAMVAAGLDLGSRAVCRLRKAYSRRWI